MINNEFHLIGTCVSNYEVLGTKKFKTYTFRVEVEKYNGGVFEIEAVVYSSNHVINVDEPLIGKQIAINGFIDSFKDKTGAIRMKPVCQNIMVLNKKQGFNQQPKVEEMKGEVKTSSTEEYSTDDLPF